MDAWEGMGGVGLGGQWVGGSLPNAHYDIDCINRWCYICAYFKFLL